MNVNKQDIENIFSKFNDLQVLIIGDVMIDSYMWGSVDRISPEAPVPIIASTHQENRLGGAANVALNIQALGATPILCAVIGEDLKSRTFLELMKKRNLPTEGILKDPGRPTTVKTRIISDNQHLLRVDEESKSFLDKKTEKRFIAQIHSMLETQKIDAVVFEDYDKGCITRKTIESTTELCRSKGIPTLVDPKKRSFNHYKGVTLFKPNFKELTEGLKIDIEKRDIPAVYEASLKLKNKLNAKYIMVTLSESGVMITNDSSYYHIPAEIRDIADVSGAGDTMISTASLCLAAGLKPELIAEISNLAGGLVCENVGVVPINKEKLFAESQEKFCSTS